MSKLIFLTVWFLVFGSCFWVSHGQFCSFNSCYDSSGNALPCVPSPISISLKRNVSVTNTCGSERSEYCELSGPSCPTDDGKYLYCDASSSEEKHPKSYLVDEEPQKYTWWQSQNWFETNQLGLTNTNNPLKVNITLSFGKSYHISGHVQVTFYTERPKAMFIEKSTDDGHTWQPMQYFASRCDKTYNMEASNPPDASDPFKVQCTERYSLPNPHKLGKVVFDSGSRYHVCDYQTPKVQNYLLATNVRIRLEYPATDGLERLGGNLKRYYYAISDIEITGRCNCNGHARFCTGSLMNRECTCEHNTMGRDCEVCKPLFNNRPWSPANKTHGNECQECQCNGRGTSCIYNSTLGHGLCKGCQNNTEGDHCEKCVDRFFRDLTKPLNDAGACVACDCFPDGIVNNGSCLQNATSAEQIGQCTCKPKVYGRKCDQCKPGHWGFTIPPLGECQACNCTSFGTRGGSIECQQMNGQCTCKETTQGQHCNECKFGYHGFPQGEAEECKKCSCDLGGAFPGCDKQTGACHCRQGVEGQLCTSAVNGTFYPALDYLLLEAESAIGNYVTHTPSNGFGSAFTGRGYAQLSSGQHVHFNLVNTKVGHQYFAVVRYTFLGQCSLNNTELEFKVHGPGLHKNYTVMLADLEKGSGRAWRMPGLLPLVKGLDYNFTVTYMYHYNVTNDCKVQVDSLVLVPNINGTRVFTLSSKHVQSTLPDCINSRIAVSRMDSEQANCTSLVFSASTEIYNGTLECDCDPKGSFNPSQCSPYGGQCRCKPGVGGRRCDQCLTGYYSFTNSGCTKCGCSEAGSLTSVCDVTTGLCQCKPYVLGSKCDQCKPNTFNVDRNNPKGCQYCFGYGHATGCTSASGFVASRIETEFTTRSDHGWSAVDEQDNPVRNLTLLANGSLIMSTPPSQTVVYLSAPAKFLGDRLWSYKQRLELVMNITPGGSEILNSSDVILEGRGRNATLFMTPSPSPDTNSYHVVLDEKHVTPSNSVTPFEFQSILTNLTSIKVRALYFLGGSVSFKRISLTHAVQNETLPEIMQVRFVENASCHQNYSGLSCETCAPGYKREILSDSPFGRCVICSCNGRSTRCHPDTGVCTNCEVGTYGDRCEHCTNNVQGPDCTRCKTGYWGLSRSGCGACNCSAIGTLYGNTSMCDEVTGQCSCNVSMNVEGRACDRCKETAYSVSGNSISDCRECPSCYKFIQLDLHKLRPQVAQTQNLTTRIAQHPVMMSNKNFALRLNESVREVINLVAHASVASQNDSAFQVHWTALGQAFDSLESLVKNNLSENVNASSLVGLSAQSNYQVIKETITNVVGLVKKAYRVLNTTVDQKTRLVGAQLDLLKKLAVNLDNLTRQALYLENSTLHANTTIHSGSQYAVARANLTAINARTVQEGEDELSPYLEALLRNATDTKQLGEKAVAEGLERLEKSSSLLNQTRSLVARAATPNPDNTRTLNDLNMHLNNLDSTTARYLNDTRTIFESSLPVVAQVNLAVVRAQDLVSKVSQVVDNSTAQAASAESSNQIANNAINQANQVHHDATYMLDVMKNFESVSHEAILRANASLSRSDTLEQQLSEVIGNASSISVDVQDSVNASMRALRLGGLSYQLADNESKVISEEFVRVKKLKNDSHQADILLSNQSLLEYIKRDIEPKENTCRNLTNKATNLSTQANALLHLANETNSKARHVVEQTQRALNESKVLALDDPNNSIPELNQAIAKVRESFAALNLTANITQLRDNIQTHKGKFQQNQLRKNNLMLEIKRVRQLIDSFKVVNRECQK